jgi:hypothetical protein
VRLCLWTEVTNVPIVNPPDDIWVWKATVEWYWQGKPMNSGGNCLSATLTTKSPTWTNLGTNLGFHGERPVTNRLSHGTALFIRYSQLTWFELFGLMISWNPSSSHKCWIQAKQCSWKSKGSEIIYSFSVVGTTAPLPTYVSGVVWSELALFRNWSSYAVT